MNQNQEPTPTPSKGLTFAEVTRRAGVGYQRGYYYRHLLQPLEHASGQKPRYPLEAVDQLKQILFSEPATA